MDLKSILAVIGVGVAIAVLIQNMRLSKQLRESMKKYSASNEDVGHLIEEFRKFKVAFDYSYDAILIADFDGTVLYCNDSFSRVTKFSREEIIGSKAGKLWGGSMPKSFYERLWKTLKVDKQPFYGTVTNHRKNGEAYDAAVSIAPIFNADESGVEYFVAVERDLSHNP